jgi:sigma-B regulation protein RsbU (phosphoserine phosphatase)
MVERLNRVIHQSGLTSRFISLFFGELERNGNLSYINAGHPPPLLQDARGIRELSVGGMLLGPDPGATYKMGFVHVDRGASLIAYSDGVIEREDARAILAGRRGLAAGAAMRRRGRGRGPARAWAVRRGGRTRTTSR